MARIEGILRLLIVDNSLTDADSVINSIRSAGHAVRATRVESMDDLESELRSHTFDMVICRDEIPAISPVDVVTIIHNLAKDIPSIVLVNSQESKPGLFTSGAKDIVLQSDVPRLQFAVNREIDSLFSRRMARRNERALRESEKRSHSLLESSRDAVAYMHEGMHIYVNSAYLHLFGFDEAEDIDGLPFLDMIAVEDHGKFKAVFRKFSEQQDAKPQTISVQCVKSDGQAFRASIEFSHARVEGENCTQVVIRDEATQILTSAQDDILKDRDFVTGLYNRARFMDELEKIIDLAAEGKGDAELLYIVLDNFRAIKEQVGLGASDNILKNTGELLRKNMNADEVLGYYSDRVFTVVIPSDNDQKVDERAEFYRKLISDYISEVDGKSFDLKCSIGISRISESLASANVAVENADRACMVAQKEGGNQIGRFKPVIEQQKVTTETTSTEWKNKLQSAINNDEFKLLYQPIVSLHGEEQEVYEVLLRLEENGESVNPEEFFHHAKQAGLMTDIDKWVTRQSLEKLVEHRKTFPKTRFFIKLSEETICSDNFVDWLCVTLNSKDLDGNVLTFEISETSALQHIDMAKSMVTALKNIGCEFGLEHFGSGIDFSRSLSELDVDYIKINGNFVQNMARDAENQAAVKAIIEMSREAGKSCIAEFVSDANSLALLWRLGVDYAQGFYIHEPSEELDYNFEDDDL
jgi:diguanylate cyclase (GGDEF)-like protein/PAS domain S-box-containing protein